VPARDIDEFLAGVPEEARAALERLRKQIQAAAPAATEAISYGIPAFKLRGRPLIGFGATKRHCALYVMSSKVIEAHAADLEGYHTSTGTIRFPADRPPLPALVKKLVRARISEQEAGTSG
jgi:uncharacterized protein YdhG (YjbR/CyaY superfamily)